ncbi:MAG: hypothetical protein H7644_14425 [Candidatus Heimdallarchaeota archaeon]|nr:hypothetical protein [Candidatus Heimdallarchaeota archaeon]MCK5144959.1 hypothetical protein [Candidatus Heimdallarchaeota archaeon]
MNSNLKIELLIVFQELYSKIWNTLVNIIGETSTIVLFKCSMKSVSDNFAFLDTCSISDAGICLDLDTNHITVKELRNGLISWVDNFVSLITEMTGDIITKKIEPMITEFKESDGCVLIQ